MIAIVIALLFGVAIGTLAGIKWSARVYGSHLAIKQEEWKSMAQNLHSKITDLESELYCDCEECAKAGPETYQPSVH